MAQVTICDYCGGEIDKVPKGKDEEKASPSIPVKIVLADGTAMSVEVYVHPYKADGLHREGEIPDLHIGCLIDAIIESVKPWFVSKHPKPKVKYNERTKELFEESH